ncbi:MAG: hypothetical protein ACLGH4_10265, partial [Actinomycetes bacterium]
TALRLQSRYLDGTDRIIAANEAEAASHRDAAVTAEEHARGLEAARAAAEQGRAAQVAAYDDQRRAAPRGRPRPADFGATAAEPPVDPAAQDAAAHRDDPTMDAQDTAALLSDRLGAEVIEEIPHR